MCAWARPPGPRMAKLTRSLAPLTLPIGRVGERRPRPRRPPSRGPRFPGNRGGSPHSFRSSMGTPGGREGGRAARPGRSGRRHRARTRAVTIRRRPRAVDRRTANAATRLDRAAGTRLVSEIADRHPIASPDAPVKNLPPAPQNFSKFARLRFPGRSTSSCNAYTHPCSRRALTGRRPVSHETLQARVDGRSRDWPDRRGTRPGCVSSRIQDRRDARAGLRLPREPRGAWQRLTPPWEKVEVVEGGESIRPGSRVVLETKLGPFPLRWVAEHTEYEPGRMFADTQVSGPFARWYHRHCSSTTARGGRSSATRSITSRRSGALGRLAGGRVPREEVEQAVRLPARGDEAGRRVGRLPGGGRTTAVVDADGDVRSFRRRMTSAAGRRVDGDRQESPG